MKKALIVVVILFILGFGYLSFELKAETSNSYLIDSSLFNESNTYNFNNNNNNSNILNNQVEYNMNTKNSNLVSTSDPLVTFVTHGLGGFAVDYGQNSILKQAQQVIIS
ncbi:MAG: hypothetical protein LBV55_03650 [Acholeplasmatales bacterium]|jgi:hypothetical protein|nr:hypothetical protein [Acholeplasmatales bacterium]